MGEWIKSEIQNFTGTLVCWIEQGGKRIFSIREQESVCPREEFEKIVKLIAAAPKLLKVAERMANIFPDEDTADSLDAADFVDRAHEIFSTVLQARTAIAEVEKGA